MSVAVGKLFVTFLVAAFLIDLLQHNGYLVIAEAGGDPAVNDKSPPQSASSSRPPAFCNCQQEDVDANTAGLLAVMNRIVQSPFFRYYKANTHKECPYWAVQLLCTAAASSATGEANPCGLCTCNEEEIPLSIRATDANEIPHGNDEEEKADSHVLLTSTPTSVHLWGQAAEEVFGRVPPETAEHNDEYVDLVVNPEGNTGYTGPMANRVWEAIYAENCLSDAAAAVVPPPQGDAADRSPQQEEETCSEFFVFYRLMSGFHSSIGINVATNFYRTKETPSATSGAPAAAPVYTANCGMLNRMRSFADRRENLNFLYQFVLRAVSKVAPALMHDARSGAFHSGDAANDQRLVEDLEQLFASPLLCSSTFDDAKFLQSKHAHHLIPQMLAKMKNVSRLMDCVSCEKCRLWGKLEAAGIATAIKIIVSTENIVVSGSTSDRTPLGAAESDDGGCIAGHDSLVLDSSHDSGLHLDAARRAKRPSSSAQSSSSLRLLRTEKVALVNLLRQLTVAVWSVAHNCNS